MTYRGDYQESSWYPQQGHGYQQTQAVSWPPPRYDQGTHGQRLGHHYQQPPGRPWPPPLYDQGVHLQRLGYFHRPPQPPGPAWQAAPAWDQPSYSPAGQPPQSGPRPGRPSRGKSRPARRKLAALRRHIKIG